MKTMPRIGIPATAYRRAFWLLLWLYSGAILPATAAAVTATTLEITSNGSSAATAPSGTVITLTALVTAGSAPITVGQVDFCDATAPYCTDIHLLGSAQLTSTGAASMKLIPGIGSHTYKAVYVGTTANGASASNASGLTITGSYPTTTVLTQTGTAGNYTLTASVAGNAPAAPTGSVSFLDVTNNGNLLGDGTLSPAAPALSFLNGSSLDVGANPFPAVTADLNNDGKPDLITIAGQSSLGVFLGNGDGTFTPTPSPVLGFATTNIAVGDFNSDGKLDLAVVDTADAGLSILLGNGDGTFAAPLAPVFIGPFGTTPAILIATDLNGDGQLDLAVASEKNETGGEAGIYAALGNGDGTFTPVSAQIPLDYPYSMAAGDFNSDGRVDLVVSGGIQIGRTSVLLGNGDGTFTAQPDLGFAYPGSLAVGDFNGDGKTDFAITIDLGVAVLLGKGDGTFIPVSSVTMASLYSIVVGDFNADGKPDLAGIDRKANAIAVLLGNGDGTLANPIFATTGNFPIAAAVADWNGDGTPDLATADANDNTLAILLGHLSTSTTTLTGVAPGGTGVHQIQASYPGDDLYLASLSKSLGLTATPAAPITFTVANHTYGDPAFTVSASSTSSGAFTYSVVSGPATISGSTVTLTGAGTVILQASQAAADYYAASMQTASFSVSTAHLSVSANDAVRVFGAANPAFTGTFTGAVNGDLLTETFFTTATPASLVGTYPIVPSITGANIASYTVGLAPGSLTVSQAGTATTFALSNSNTALTANVASLTSGIPTGSVSFYQGQAVIGTAALADGVASYAISSLPVGSVIAQYSGDANFTQSGSPATLVLSIAPANASLSAPQSGSVTDTIQVTPAPGYSGTVQLSCSGLPQSTTCAFQPSSVSFTGIDVPASVALTINTGAATPVASKLQPYGDLPPVLAVVLWAPNFFGLALSTRKRHRLFGAAKFLLLLCCIGAAMTACGGGSSSTNPSPVKTPVGSFTVHLVASGTGGFSQTADLTLNIQ